MVSPWRGFPSMCVIQSELRVGAPPCGVARKTGIEGALRPGELNERVGLGFGRL